MYVYKMLSSQEGLACWETVDLGRFAGTRGVLLGDVGTYSPKGGFKKVFNLWDDVVPIRCTEGTFKEVTYSPPKKHATTHQGALRRGDTIAEGASARTVPGRHRDIERFEFDCKDQPNGAVLALTSPADRETLDDCEGLRNHIIDNAELFYRHADLQRTIGANQPVYIITGSLKSETCGLAVFISPMQSGKDTIKLEYSSQLSLPSGRQPVLPFQWTDKWTAEARTPSGQQSGVKDLSLFLQGFKLDFSDAFRARMKPESNAAGHSRTLGSGGTDGDGGGSGVGEDNAREGSGFSGSSGEGAQQESRGEGGAGFGSGTQSREQALEPNTDRPTSEDTDRKGAKPVEDITIKSFPSTGREVAYHPCDTINEFLLKHTDASFALTHDEDWKHLLDSRTLFSVIIQLATRMSRNLGLQTQYTCQREQELPSWNFREVVAPGTCLAPSMMQATGTCRPVLKYTLIIWKRLVWGCLPGAPIRAQQVA
ncbi:hypothetical protein DFP72DRAFT_632694 [Ephemerocybe angulata]|uniref:Uncharacterized protein n=1 Tax=Ephemerocybe angulata TaxID=980116 RepID=A0A8H6MF90_9AGAR|nr:hypothetical protein DFP72DRAFT_632694 [Tulosesus angulatus]